MAGTNKKKKLLFFNPVIILKEPALPENIGMVARTMVNFGFKHLRLIKPKTNWPNKKSASASAGAFEIIGKYTKVYNNLKDSIKDIDYLCACTVRARDIEKRVTEPKVLIRNIKLKYNSKKIGFLFGTEKSGLENMDIVEADIIANIPSNAGFSSLNLAMAVNIVCYEWFSAFNHNKTNKKINKNINLANKEKVIFFSNQVIKALHELGFYKKPQEKEKLLLNVKNMIANARFSDKDLKILHSILKAFLKNK